MEAIIAIGAAVAVLTGIGAGAVSYTHLDVYKRQAHKLQRISERFKPLVSG